MKDETSEGVGVFGADYRWIKESAFAADDGPINEETSKRRLADHPMKTWRQMESRLYTLSHVHRRPESYISRRLDLCPTEFAELRKINGRGRLPCDDIIPRRLSSMVFLPCTD